MEALFWKSVLDVDEVLDPSAEGAMKRRKALNKKAADEDREYGNAPNRPARKVDEDEVSVL